MKKVLFVLFFAAVAFAGCSKQEAPATTESAPAATAPAAPEAPATTAAPQSTAAAQ